VVASIASSGIGAALARQLAREAASYEDVSAFEERAASGGARP
jgi:hypothetical protein